MEIALAILAAVALFIIVPLLILNVIYQTVRGWLDPNYKPPSDKVHWQDVVTEAKLTNDADSYLVDVYRQSGVHDRQVQFWDRDQAVRYAARVFSRVGEVRLAKDTEKELTVRRGFYRQSQNAEGKKPRTATVTPVYG